MEAGAPGFVLAGGPGTGSPASAPSAAIAHEDGGRARPQQSTAWWERHPSAPAAPALPDTHRSSGERCFSSSGGNRLASPRPRQARRCPTPPPPLTSRATLSPSRLLPMVPGPAASAHAQPPFCASARARPRGCRHLGEGLRCGAATILVRAAAARPPSAGAPGDGGGSYRVSPFWCGLKIAEDVGQGGPRQSERHLQL